MVAAQAQITNVVPRPQQREALPGVGFLISNHLAAACPETLPLGSEHLRVFGDALSRGYGVALELGEKGPALRVILDFQLAPEEYRLEIGQEIRIEVADGKALAHATATLLQLWGTVGSIIPAQRIHDWPSNSYRSLMVDLGRNPLSLEALRETLDLLWFYKLDSLHLHLTDDQRFAFPSIAFPDLVSGPGQLTREDFAALEQDAAVRGISLIPELDVPGHSTLLRQRYPEVFGTTSTELASLPSSREGLQVLLDEMIALFPSSPYVHIGGDEAYGVPAALQRELINVLDDHLRSRAKTTLVWEGPGLGEGANKVQEDVIHLNWRTVNFPAPEMIAAGYRVVNAAWDPLYVVDHYPRNNFTMAAPGHIYRRLDRYRFGHFNPDMPTFLHPQVVAPTDRVLGYCMPWWEGREENYFPLLVPRLLPLAAVAWSEPKSRNAEAFSEESAVAEKLRLQAFYPLSIEADPLAVDSAGVFWNHTTVRLEIRSIELSGSGAIHLTLDGSEPTPQSPRYEKPFSLQATAIVRATVFRDGKPFGHGSRRTFVGVTPVDNLALGKPVTASVPAGPVFCPARLTDGGLGNLDQFLGYPAAPQPIAITVDLETVQTIQRVVVHEYLYGDSFESYEIALSVDGQEWQTVAQRLVRPQSPAAAVAHDFPPAPARFVRILSNGHHGQVFDSFSRLTEIQVF